MNDVCACVWSYPVLNSEIERMFCQFGWKSFALFRNIHREKEKDKGKKSSLMFKVGWKHAFTLNIENTETLFSTFHRQICSRFTFRFYEKFGMTTFRKVF